MDSKSSGPAGSQFEESGERNGASGMLDWWCVAG